MDADSEVPIGQHFLDYAMKRFQYLKTKAERAINQVTNDEDLFRLLDSKSNSIAIIMKHLAGNMKSRWTNFLTTNGEKPTRDRLGEFDRSYRVTRSELLGIWEDGWNCVFDAIAKLRPGDLMKDVRIRGRELSILEAIGWQLSHYSQHIGQIIFLAKHIKPDSWEYLTMPPNERFYSK